MACKPLIISVVQIETAEVGSRYAIAGWRKCSSPWTVSGAFGPSSRPV